MQFYYVYILESKQKSFVYIGVTKHYAPFALIFYEACLSKTDASRREKYFKTTKGKTTLKSMLKDYSQQNETLNKDEVHDFN